MDKPRVVVAGSRNIHDRDLIRAEMMDIADLIGEYEVVSGTARGPDSIGAEIAREWGWDVKEFPAQWERYGKAAGFIRNGEMGRYAAEGPDEGWLLAFHDGESRGTSNMIGTGRDYSLHVRVVHVLDDGPAPDRCDCGDATKANPHFTDEHSAWPY